MMAIPEAHLPMGNLLLQSLGMELMEHYRLRLQELLSATGLKQFEFAARCDMPPDYLSRLLYPPGKKGRKNIGIAVAHKISRGFALSPGWFDLPLGTELPSAIAQASSSRIANTPIPWPGPIEANDSGPTDSIRSRRTPVTWPFKLVTYERIQRVKEHFGKRGMPNAMTEIDKHLDVIVSRWEQEMHSVKSSAA